MYVIDTECIVPVKIMVASLGAKWLCNDNFYLRNNIFMCKQLEILLNYWHVVHIPPHKVHTNCMQRPRAVYFSVSRVLVATAHANFTGFIGSFIPQRARLLSFYVNQVPSIPCHFESWFACGPIELPNEKCLSEIKIKDTWLWSPGKAECDLSVMCC